MKTFCMIKPDAFPDRIRNEILKRLDTAGFRGGGKWQLRLMSKSQVELFYAEHKGKPFFDNNVKFITSGPCLGLILEKDNAIQDLRAFVGNTDPVKADEGTIRGDFGSELPKNAIHASDSEESVKREIDIFFNYKVPEEVK